VIEGEDKIEVTTLEEKKKRKNGKKYLAKVIGSDPRTDIALIKIEVDKKLPFAYLGDSEKLGKGDWVVAIGNPFGLDHSASIGIVSAKGREISTNENRRVDDFIQTDAAINFGNSGGPLVNLKGEVIGINTAITAQGSGIGFAVPVNVAKDIIRQLKSHGGVKRGYLGVMIQDVSEEIKEAMKLKMAKGVLVNDVLPDGPAEKGGIKRGDVLVKVGGKSVADARGLQKIVGGLRPNKSVDVQLIRNRKLVHLKMKLGSLDEDDKKESKAGDTEMKPDRLGLVITTNKELHGVEVLHVEPNSAAESADIIPGDIVHKINGKSVKTAEEFKAVVKKLKSKSTVLLDLQRRSFGSGKMKLFLAFRVP
jgi:serine protease Do